ncbi:MAG: DUF488 family protein [Syntrophobacteria bacterium]
MSPKASLYSIGHGNRSFELFLALLQFFKIEQLADIRSFPGSKRNPHFNRENLEKMLGPAGISYSWLPDLGGFRKKGLGPNSPHLALVSAGFRNYADYMDTEPFQAAVGKLQQLANTGGTCFMCAETLPQRCHRLLVSDYLCVQGIQVIHILDRKRSIVHKLSKTARVEQGHIIYDRSGSRQRDLEP